MEDLFNTIRVRDRARPMELLFESAILKSLYLDKDPLITENIFPRLEIKLADRSFQDKFLKLYKANLLRERASHVEMANRCEAARSDPRFYTAQIPSVDRALSIESFQEYQEFLQDPNEGHPGIIELMSQEVQRRSGGHQGDRYVRHTYHLYEIARVLYEHYISRASLFQRFDHPMSVKLVEAYKEINIDLAASDTQFSKYNLLSLTDTFRIANEKEFQIIVDDRLGLNFGINVPRLLLKTIEQTIAQGLIKNIAFHIESILEFTPSFEDLEYGALFSFDALQLPELSKLYDGEMYSDSLWVKMEKQKSSMTFEELCTDFPELDGMVVTQLVHLEFFEEQGQLFIHHLDHEYILYTLDMYAARETDARVKGHKKLKTFKIDNSRIPFDFKLDGRHFLFTVLDAYFINKTLIKEYFSKTIV